MQPLLGFFGIGLMELVVLSFIALLVVAMAVGVGVLLWVLLRSRKKDSRSNE